MDTISKFKPKFWDHSDSGTIIHGKYYNFRKIWKSTLILTLTASLIPLLILAAIDYRVNKKALESEIIFITSNLVSNTKRSLSFFLDERKAALDFISLNNKYEELVSPNTLVKLLDDLKKGFGGFVDIGVIDENGTQVAYEGLYQLKGKNYYDSNWFKETVAKDFYISEVFKGFRNIPHMVIAVKHSIAPDRFYLIRATIDTERFDELLSNLEMEGGGDAFLVNKEGILQTPSRNHGKVLDKIKMKIPEYSEKSTVEYYDKDSIIMGYAYITNSPFILLIVKYKKLLERDWHQTRSALIVFLIFSVVVISIVILGGITYLVNQLYFADKRRLLALHKAEYANKMASLGLLSAGVAHEINNPLAIINEKAGLIKDIFTFDKKFSEHTKLMELVDSIISSVERCGNITHRLLDFARRSEGKTEKVDIRNILKEVLGFMGKEAEYREIKVDITVGDDIFPFESDKGKLQEIFLNLLTNAFAAVENRGRVIIDANKKDENYLLVRIVDNGCGIHSKDLERVFEPFFSTRAGKGGTGLGLSITYGLVKELGGQIKVESDIGKGTAFEVFLPIQN